MAQAARDNTNQAPMEHDEETLYDDDSALGDAGMSTQTQSLSSSIYDYRVENGRYEVALATLDPS